MKKILGYQCDECEEDAERLVEFNFGSFKLCRKCLSKAHNLVYEGIDEAFKELKCKVADLQSFPKGARNITVPIERGRYLNIKMVEDEHILRGLK